MRVLSSGASFIMYICVAFSYALSDDRDYDDDDNDEDNDDRSITRRNVGTPYFIHLPTGLCVFLETYSEVFSRVV